MSTEVAPKPSQIIDRPSQPLVPDFDTSPTLDDINSPGVGQEYLVENPKATLDALELASKNPESNLGPVYYAHMIGRIANKLSGIEKPTENLQRLTDRAYRSFMELVGKLSAKDIVFNGYGQGEGEEVFSDLERIVQLRISEGLSGASKHFADTDKIASQTALRLSKEVEALSSQDHDQKIAA